VLAGANRSPETGLCRGEELAELDLRGTQVVVLSACNTARGKLASGEGVLGLQRALALSGARCSVASLWKVRDAATSVLMEEFYRQLWEHKRPPLEALRQAQLFVLKNPERLERRERELRRSGVRDPEEEAVPLPKAAGKRSSPALWAAFVLAGDWR
jgi:CHAT domain-containing protein